MAVTVNINNLTLCHNGSDGVSTATIPNVCKTPSPGGPIPIPYPNVAMSSDLANGSVTVTADGGNMCAIAGSEFFKSTGDEAGLLGGLSSSTFIKEATWITYSFDVTIEGQAACRLTDKMFHNHQNTVNMGGEIQAPQETRTVDECKDLYESFKKEALKISDDGGDPIKNGSQVNRRITKAYSEMYQRRPDLHWSGAATFVSKQMGCNMRYADSLHEKSGLTKWLGKKSTGSNVDDLASSTKKVLVQGNEAIFNDIYPQYRLYEVAPECATDSGEEVGLPPKMVTGFDEYNKGNAFSAMMAHAEYEQKVILQGRVFDNPAMAADVSNFKVSQQINGGWLAWVTGNHQPEQVSFSASCMAEPPFIHNTLPGDFTGVDSRWKTAVDTLRSYDDMMKSHPQEMLNAIKEIGRDMGTGNLRIYGGDPFDPRTLPPVWPF